MGEKYLTKIVKLLWRISTKIMQQAEQQALNKLSTRKGDIFGYTTQNWYWFTSICTRCGSICVTAAPNIQIKIGCHVKHVVSLSQLFECRLYAPINLKPAGGEAGHGVGIWHFSKICRQNPCPRANHSSKIHKNFPTPDGILLSIIPRLDARKTQGKQENSIIFTSQRYYVSKGTIFNKNSTCI